MNCDEIEKLEKRARELAKDRKGFYRTHYVRDAMLAEIAAKNGIAIREEFWGWEDAQLTKKNTVLDVMLLMTLRSAWRQGANSHNTESSNW